MALLEESFDNSVKVIIVGNGTVGKSSLITRFSDGKYTSDYKKTLAVDFIEKTRQIKKNDGGDETLTFFLWDTAGQEEYNSITRAYYRGASAAVIVFSTTDRASFHAVHHWHRSVSNDASGSLTTTQESLFVGRRPSLSSGTSLPLFKSPQRDQPTTAFFTVLCTSV
uniref:Ras family domain-containing protein n=1 Tax=Toxoplasma gondii (strain ATCC 50861 / VEG) TaxID=432359 RepID=A0A0F7UX51_TOXGV|nr:TPA: Ras family domain-containing protein [Toxoplasma gondii VEG]